MVKQKTMFDMFDDAARTKPRSDLPPHQRDSATSKEAAELVAPSVSTQQRMVLEYIRSLGVRGSTDFEGITHFRPTWKSVDNAYRARRGELAEAGFIVKHPDFRVINNRKQDVWIAREFKGQAK